MRLFGENKKIIIYKTDAPAVQAPPWAAPPSDPTPEMPFTEATRTAPARPALVESDVIVPFLQTVVTGLFVGFAAIGVVIEFEPLAWIGGVLAVVWIVLLIDHRKLLRTVEVVIGRDLDNDGAIGRPVPLEQMLRVEVGQDNTTYFLDVPHNKAVAFARSVMAGRSMSESEWKKFFGGIEPFKTFRGRLLDAKLVRWVNPDAHAQGVVLTPAGRKVFERLAKLPPAEQ